MEQIIATYLLKGTNGRLSWFTRALLTLVTASALPKMGHCAIVTTGNFKTGTPTPTLIITVPFTLTITATGSVNILDFDEWVTNDGSGNAAFSLPGQTLSYQIDGGATQTVPIRFLSDNTNSTISELTANDGYLLFDTDFPVTAGQTLTFLPSSATFGSGGAAFNQRPTPFTGNAFVTDINGNALSVSGSVGPVPEPSTFGLLFLGGGMGLLGYRGRNAA